jgi:hypothetical protein
MDPRRLFATTATWFVEVVGALPTPEDDPALWAAPALGVWDVRALVGHTNRALLTVAAYLSAEDGPADSPEVADDVGDAFGYLHAIAGSVAEPDDVAARGVAARGVAAGAALGSAPAAAVALARDGALAAVGTAGREARITVVGGLRLPVDKYLRTRVLELVVHGDDLVRAVAGAGHVVTLAVPEEAVRASSRLLTEAAVRRGNGPLLLRALSGRGGLPAGYSVL